MFLISMAGSVKPLKQVDQGNRALFCMLLKYRKLNLPVDIQVELFDQLVVPIVTYGCEVWGYENIKCAEIFYTKFLKRLLHLNKSTANCMIYSEVGKHPLSKTVELRMLNFWHSLLISDQNKISSKMYLLLRSMDLKNIYHSPWIIKIKSLLNNCGLPDYWNTAQNIEHKQFTHILKQRLNDIYEQQIQADIENNNSHCNFYKIIKNLLILSMKNISHHCLLMKGSQCVNLGVEVISYEL